MISPPRKYKRSMGINCPIKRILQQYCAYVNNVDEKTTRYCVLLSADTVNDPINAVNRRSKQLQDLAVKQVVVLVSFA